MYSTLSPTSISSMNAEKVCLITGGSSGIGAEIARHLASLGYGNLAIVARRKEKLEEVLVVGHGNAGNKGQAFSITHRLQKNVNKLEQKMSLLLLRTCPT